MPKDISAELQATLEGGTVPLCTCIKLTRKDGTVLGFTSLDTAITFDGVTYEPADAMNISSISQAVGDGVNTLEMAGIISDGRITVEELRARLYAGAEILVFNLNFEDTSEGEEILGRGYIGNISILTEDQFEAEFRSLGQKTAQSVGRVIGSDCPFRLGDHQCQKAMAALRHTELVDAVSVDGKSLTFNGRTETYTKGQITAQSGDNTGIALEIKSSSVAGGNVTIVLTEAFPFDVSVGDSFLLEEGCDGTWVRCGELANRPRFGGFPFVRGNDFAQQVGR